MNDADKGIFINAIIVKLNETLIAKNKKFASENLHEKQEPLHGADMFFKLAFMPIAELNKIAKLCGI